MLSVSGRNWNTVCGSKPDYGPVDVQRSYLLNGIGVVGAKTFGGQICACTIMYQVTKNFKLNVFFEKLSCVFWYLDYIAHE